jgi:hypothetical protein
MDGYQASKLTYFDIISLIILPGGVMVARRALDAEIGVRIPAGQQKQILGESLFLFKYLLLEHGV